MPIPSARNLIRSTPEPRKQGGSPLASFTYDGKGRRATKTAGGVTTGYVYEGAQFLEERPSAGAAKRYVYGLGIDRPLAQSIGGVTSYFLADHLGSIVEVTDASGAPTLTREYDPWGNALQGSATSGYAFTGREWDVESGLYYYRARYYDPRLGRFIGEDPVGLRGGNNRFRYVRNRPPLFRDPTGHVELVMQNADYHAVPWSVVQAQANDPHALAVTVAEVGAFCSCTERGGCWRPKIRITAKQDVYYANDTTIPPEVLRAQEAEHVTANYGFLDGTIRAAEALEATEFCWKSVCTWNCFVFELSVGAGLWMTHKLVHWKADPPHTW